MAEAICSINISTNSYLLPLQGLRTVIFTAAHAEPTRHEELQEIQQTAAPSKQTAQYFRRHPCQAQHFQVWFWTNLLKENISEIVPF